MRPPIVLDEFGAESGVRAAEANGLERLRCESHPD